MDMGARVANQQRVQHYTSLPAALTARPQVTEGASVLSSPSAHLRITWSALHCYVTSHLLCVQQLRSQSVKSVGDGRKKLGPATVYRKPWTFP
jgi:hypothetical protein